MQRRGDDQPTVFTDAAIASQTQTPTQTPSTKLEASAAAPPRGIARRTGVVFVHGIGTQGPSETFLDWSGAIVELLTDWRASEAAADPSRPGERVDDPVWRAEFTFNAASPPYLELAIPEHAEVPATTWVITEAWWASDLRPPDLGMTIDYLRRRIATVVSGIADGYRDRSPRLVELAMATDVIGEPPPLDWRVAEGLDKIQSRTFGARPIGWLVAGTGVVALAGYDVLRRIPIPVVRDFAIRKMIDSFIVDWFGDLPVLLDEPVQSANVRARLARSIQRLVDDGCDAIVVVAHSGGALVSFETLLDPAYAHLPVDKLVTLGQGLGLSWRLAADPDVREITPGSRLVGDLGEVRPGLRWVDVWASFDPAPAGPIPAQPPWLLPAPVALPGESPPTPPPGTILVESRPVTNEMNVLTDHGGYWANPEGFVIPLVRHIDAALGDAGASRFYRDRTDRTLRIVWRRQRVSALAAWGWLCSVGAFGTALALVLLQVAGQPRLSYAGDLVVAVWDRVPGHEIISAPVAAFEAVVGALLEFVGLGALADTLASLGPVVLGLALTLGLFYALAKVGIGRWHDWDRRERRAMHPETPLLPDRSKAGAQAMLLLGGLLALVFAAFGWAPAAGIAIVLGTGAGLIVWARRPFASDGRRLRPPA